METLPTFAVLVRSLMSLASRAKSISLRVHRSCNSLKVVSSEKRALVTLAKSRERPRHATKLDRICVDGVERGERNVSLINICRLAKALGVTLSELMDFQKVNPKGRS